MVGLRNSRKRTSDALTRRDGRIDRNKSIDSTQTTNRIDRNKSIDSTQTTNRIDRNKSIDSTQTTKTTVNSKSDDKKRKVEKVKDLVKDSLLIDHHQTVVLNSVDESDADANKTLISGSSAGSVSGQGRQTDKFTTDLLQTGLQKGCVRLKLNGVPVSGGTSRNVVHFLSDVSAGIKSRLDLSQCVRTCVTTHISDLGLYRTASPFDRRVTALEWHPTKANILAVGSKGGDIILWDTGHANRDKFVQGIGAAGSCQAVKFWPWNTDKVVSASINGTVTLHDFDSQQNLTLADTMDSYDHWYCSLDVNPKRYLVGAGRNNGMLHLMSTEGTKVFEQKLHKNKITHVEFSPREEWLLCTASVDQTVKVWDVRNMRDKNSTLATLQHHKPVNSAYFSPTDGCRLLTTDQHDEIRVYQSPSWVIDRVIRHPHRFFQHISPFKATWHPLHDIIVCGRYPEVGSLHRRTIDVFDADAGATLCQLYDPGADGLCPVNKFNIRGDSLASGMGYHILLWNRKGAIEYKQSLLTKDLGSKSGPGSSLLRPSSGSSRPTRPRSQTRRNNADWNDEDDLKKKKKGTNTKLKVKTETSSVSKTKRAKKDK